MRDYAPGSEYASALLGIVVGKKLLESHWSSLLQAESRSKILGAGPPCQRIVQDNTALLLWTHRKHGRNGHRRLNRHRNV